MSLFVTAGVIVSVLAQGNSGATLLADHVSNLQKAQSLKVAFTVQSLPAAAEKYSLEFSKPGMLRVETPSSIYISDGKLVTEYVKSRNEYTQVDGGLAEVGKMLKGDEFSVWAAFFFPEQFKDAKSTVGAKITMNGTAVTPVTVNFGDKTATVYVDPKLGIARGAAFKTTKNGASAELLVRSTEITVGGAPSASEVFAFSPPVNAKKVEYSGDPTKWYYDLEEGMKVAKATGKMIFLDFNATWCGPCQMYKKNIFPTPEFMEIAKKYVLVDIDTDEQEALARKYGVSGIPDLRFLKPDGTQVHKVVGYKGMALLDDMRAALEMGD
jgi:thiol-disulfide isomerase/thioredoxin